MNPNIPNWTMVTYNKHGQEIRRLQFAAYSRDQLEVTVWDLLCQTRADEYRAYFQWLYATFPHYPVAIDMSRLRNGPNLLRLYRKEEVHTIDVALPPNIMWVDAEDLIVGVDDVFSIDTQVMHGSMRAGRLRVEARDAQISREGRVYG